MATDKDSKVVSKKPEQTGGVHKLHPSIYHAAQTGNVSNSPFLQNNDDPNLEKRVSAHGINNESVYVLDEANLAEKGIDFWENNRTHSRVNTEWWLNQLRMRKLLKQQPQQQQQPQQNPYSAFAQYTNSGTSLTASRVRFNIDNNDTKTPQDEIEDSVIEESVIENSIIEHSVLYNHEDNDNGIGGGVDNDLHEEFESLLSDYRDASKKLLNAEKDKQQNMIELNRQQTRINQQNDKIEELQRQLNIFENTLKQVNEQKNDNTYNNQQQLFDKLEQNLSENIENVMRVNITKEITEKVNQKLLKEANINNDNENNKKQEISNLLKEELLNKNHELEVLRNKLNEKEMIESDLRNKLNKTKDDIITIQQNEINKTNIAQKENDKQKNDLSLLKEKLQKQQFENQNLLNTIKDLQYELELQRKSVINSGNYDDIKQQNISNDDNDNDDNDNDNDNDNDQNVNKPLLNNNDDGLRQRNKGKGRTPRNNKKSKEYVGLGAKEYFLQRGWCCGFVCCDSAYGCGSY